MLFLDLINGIVVNCFFILFQDHLVPVKTIEIHFTFQQRFSIDLQGYLVRNV